jgi:osmotically-inducible protein OsmY
MNEIRVADSEGAPGYVRDTWITTRLRTALTFEKNVQSLNYSIDTVQGVVYLMGVAMNQQELDKVLQIARTIPNVKQVVNYVKMVGEPVTPQGVTQ